YHLRRAGHAYADIPRRRQEGTAVWTETPTALFGSCWRPRINAEIGYPCRTPLRHIAIAIDINGVDIHCPARVCGEPFNSGTNAGFLGEGWIWHASHTLQQDIDGDVGRIRSW